MAAVAISPSIDNVVRSIGSTAGGTAVTITGSLFVDGATVTFGGISATGVKFVSATTITAVAPANAVEGPVDVEVTNPDTQTGAKVDGYTYETATGPVTLSLIVSAGDDDADQLEGGTMDVSSSLVDHVSSPSGANRKHSGSGSPAFPSPRARRSIAVCSRRSNPTSTARSMSIFAWPGRRLLPPSEEAISTLPTVLRPGPAFAL